MVTAAVPIKYNFYHSDGGGRDGFIRHVSEHQTQFNYVPKAPEFVGTRMPGMSSNMVGLTNKPSYFDKPLAVTGYTGQTVPAGRDWGEATAPDAFPGLPCTGAAPAPMQNLVSSFHAQKNQHERTIQAAGYRTPGYAGHCPGHQHVCGFTHGAICWGDAGDTPKLAAIGSDAPGLNAGDQSIKIANLQKGAYVPPGISKTKTGYTGHLHGRHYSSNFGEPNALTAEKLLKSADAGTIPHVGEYSTEYPDGARPMRQKVAVSGYAGFRPRTTPQAFN